jgi:hypothetical protein
VFIPFTVSHYALLIWLHLTNQVEDYVMDSSSNPSGLNYLPSSVLLCQTLVGDFLFARSTFEVNEYFAFCAPLTGLNSTAVLMLLTGSSVFLRCMPVVSYYYGDTFVSLLVVFSFSGSYFPSSKFCFILILESHHMTLNLTKINTNNLRAFFVRFKVMPILTFGDIRVYSLLLRDCTFKQSPNCVL